MGPVGGVGKMQSAPICQVVLVVNAHQDLLATHLINAKILMNVAYQIRVELGLCVKILQAPTLALVLKERFLIQTHVQNVMKLLHAKVIRTVQEMPSVMERNVVYARNLILEMIADVR